MNVSVLTLVMISIDRYKGERWWWREEVEVLEVVKVEVEVVDVISISPVQASPPP